MDRNLRLVKAQVATKRHECAECPEERIEPGERYMRVAIAPDAASFPDVASVPQDEAWQFVDQNWTIEKTHEICYLNRYFKPKAAQ